MAAFALTAGARLSVRIIEAHQMRFTVLATGQFRLSRAFGFSLAASSLTQLSVVNNPIRPAGLSPAWQPASPAHTRTPKLGSTPALGCSWTRPRGQPREYLAWQEGLKHF